MNCMNSAAQTAKDLYLDIEDAVELDETMTTDEAVAIVTALPALKREELFYYLAKRVAKGRTLAVALSAAANQGDFGKWEMTEDEAA